MPDIEGNIASANLSGEITTNSNLSGCIYPRGATGKSATIKIGKVITLDPEEQAEVINTGDENNAILDFKIPRGEVGHTEGGTWGKIIGKIEDQKDLMNILPNTSEFITKTVNDLENYYLKSETYTQTEVNQMISSIPKFAIEVVETLPTAEISNTTIYLLTSGTETGNLYTEYIYVNNSWEKLGTQTVDLTNYYTKEEVNSLLSNIDLSSYYTKTETNTLLNAKVNTSDLLNLVYPIGAVYMSVNNVSPATLFGGTWEQIKDKFLLSAGDTYSAGDEGGNATHKHLSPMTWYENGGSNIGTTNLYGFDKVYDRDFYGIANQKIEYNKTIEKLAYRTSTESNMPPYLVIYMWKRTA